MIYISTAFYRCLLFLIHYSAYYRQTVSFGGTLGEVKLGHLQLAGIVYSRLFVFSAGTFSSIFDFFDKNTYAGELR